MKPHLTELEQEALAAISKWPRGSELLPRHMLDTVSQLNRRGLVWRKGDNWTVTSDGEQAIARHDSGVRLPRCPQPHLAVVSH